MLFVKRWRATALSFLALFSWVQMACADEHQQRLQIGADVSANFRRGDFAAIEERYARAMARNERFESGASVANRMVRFMFTEQLRASIPPPPGMSDAAVKEYRFSAMDQACEQWAKEFPDSVLAGIALARCYGNHAWGHRGTGMHDTVTPEAWEKFRHYSTKAYEALKSREAKGRSDPNWWMVMLRTVRDLAWHRERYWALAQEAMEAVPQSYDIYFEMTEVLMPQWGGNFEQLAIFAEQAVARTRHVEDKSMYSRIYRHATQFADSDFLTRPAVNWPKIRESSEDVLRLFPGPWNTNYIARMACDAGDKAYAVRMFEQIQEPVTIAWQNRTHFQRCFEWARR